MNRIIDNDFNVDNRGIISTYNVNSVDAVKKKIELYLNINSGSIPFTTYGSNIVQNLFNVVDEAIKNELMNFMIADINRFIRDTGITVVKYKAEINKDQREIELSLILNTGELVVLNV